MKNTRVRKMFWKKKTPKDSINLDIIKRYEDFCSRPYLCPAGKPTIGYGSTTYPDGTKVTLKDKPITEKQADEMLHAYWEKEIWAKIEDNAIKLGLTNNQIIALSSLIYNIGWSSFSKSQCWKAIKREDWGEAFLNWDWIKAKGKVMKGLIKRRAEELALFMKDI